MSSGVKRLVLYSKMVERTYEQFNQANQSLLGQQLRKTKNSKLAFESFIGKENEDFVHLKLDFSRISGSTRSIPAIT